METPDFLQRTIRALLIALLSMVYASPSQASRLTPGTIIELPVIGESLSSTSGSSLTVPAAATAVYLNVTVVNPTGSGFVTVWPCGERPLASNLNYLTGDIVPNGVLAPIGPDGSVCFYSLANTDLVVDIAGWFEGDAFIGATPTRLADTRDGTGGQMGAVQPSVPLQVSVAGIPITTASGAATTTPMNTNAVALNVTVVNPAAGGFLTVYPCDVERPLASNLNYVAGGIVANGVLATTGADGNVCIYSNVPTDVIVDIAGWFPGDAFVGTTPRRLVDTRDGTGAPLGQLDPIGFLDVTIHGQMLNAGNSTIEIPTTASAVALNITAVNPQQAGFITVWPCSASRPTASNLNFIQGGVVANNVTAPIGDQGDVCFFSNVATDLVVDVAGYFSGPEGNRFVGATPRRLIDTRDDTGPSPRDPDDSDGDGIVDSLDPDDDNDGVPDEADFCPLDPTCTEEGKIEKSATMLAQHGDFTADAQSAINEAYPLGLGDDGSAVIEVILESGISELLISDAVSRELRVIARTIDSTPFVFFGRFGTVMMARSVAGANRIFLQTTTNTEGVTADGIWKIVDGILSPVLVTGDACGDGGVLNTPVLTRVTPDGEHIQVEAGCSNGMLYTYYGNPDSLTQLSTERLPIDGYPESSPAATVYYGLVHALEADGSLIVSGTVECSDSPRCFFGQGQTLLRVDLDGNFEVLVANREQLVSTDPKAFRSASITGIDEFGRVTFFGGTYPDTTVSANSPGAITQFDGADHKYVHEFQFDDQPAPGRTELLLSQNNVDFEVAANGDIMFFFLTSDDVSSLKTTLYTYRAGELDPLIREEDDAPGHLDNPLEVIYGTGISASGRVAFNSVVTDVGDIVYVEDNCEDNLLFPVDRNILPARPTPFPAFTGILVRGDISNSFNVNNQMLLTVNGEYQEVVLAELPPGRCFLDLIVNTADDNADVNPGDGTCDTGGTVDGKPSCSLRAAVTESNAIKNGATIEVDIPAQGTDIIISPASPFPSITEQLTIRPSQSMTDSIIVSGAMAGDSAGFEVLTGNFHLSDMEIRDFQGSGIDASASGNDLNLENVRLIDNGRYGVESGGFLKFLGKQQNQALIQGNVQGGVLAEGNLRMEFVDVMANLGPGIIAEKTSTLISTRVENNGAEGFVSQVDGIQSQNRLKVRSPMFSTDATLSSSFNNNAGNGIYILTGGLDLEFGTTVDGNAGSGIVLNGGKLFIGDITQPDEKTISVTGNATATTCFRVDEDNEYAVVSYSCAGGGIELTGGGSTLKSVLDDLLIHDNKGFGLLTTAPVDAHNLTVTNNLGPGIWAVQTLDPSVAALNQILNTFGTGVDVSSNNAVGLRLDSGSLKVQGSLTINNNLSSGIVISEGNVDMPNIDLAKSVTNNGSAASSCTIWTYDSEAETVSSSVGQCLQDGVVIDNGRIVGDNLTITGHTGTGLKVSASQEDVEAGTSGTAKLTLGQICNNGTDFEVAGSLELNDVNRTCP